MASTMAPESDRSLPTVLYRTPASSTSTVSHRHSVGGLGTTASYPGGRASMGGGASASMSTPQSRPMGGRWMPASYASPLTPTPTQSPFTLHSRPIAHATPDTRGSAGGRRDLVAEGGAAASVLDVSRTYGSAGARVGAGIFGSTAGTPPPPVHSLREGAHSEHAAGASNPSRPAAGTSFAFAPPPPHATPRAASEGAADARWVTVIGYRPADLGLVKDAMRACGEIIDVNERADVSGTARSALHVKFQTEAEARRALQRAGALCSQGVATGLSSGMPGRAGAAAKPEDAGGVRPARSSGVRAGAAARRVIHGASSGEGASAIDYPDHMPQPVNGFLSRVNEYLFGL